MWVFLPLLLLYLPLAKPYNSGSSHRNEFVFSSVSSAGLLHVWGKETYGASTQTDLSQKGCSIKSISNVAGVYSTERALAILKKDRTLEFCGMKGFGGTVTFSEKAKQVVASSNRWSILNDVGDISFLVDATSTFGFKDPSTESGNTKWEKLYSNLQAFVAVNENGLMTTWGFRNNGGCLIYGVGTCIQDINDVPENDRWASINQAVVDVFSTDYGFIALYDDSTVFSWGYQDETGSTSLFSSQPGGLDNVASIYTTSRAVAAVKSNGKVVVWGDDERGGCTGTSSISSHSCMPLGLSKVRVIFSNEEVFVALHFDRTITVWGGLLVGGNMDKVPSDLLSVDFARVVDVFSTKKAFVAMQDDGQVLVWGDKDDGGCDDKPNNRRRLEEEHEQKHEQDGLDVMHGAVSRRLGKSNKKGKGDDSSNNGDSSRCPHDGLVATAIASIDTAFAAITSNGGLQTWGDVDTRPPSGVTDVVSLTANGKAFVATTKTGTLYTWGKNDGGGCTSPTTAKGIKCMPSTLTDVEQVFGDTILYADSTTLDRYPCAYNHYGPTFHNCTSCPTGVQQPIGRPGIRSDIGACQKCDPGFYSSTGTFCTKCDVGRFSLPYTFYDNTIKCESCRRGKYAAASASLECKDCPKGHYASFSGASACSTCAAGKYLNDTASVSSRDCLICPSDEFSSNGAAECSPCDYGKYLERSSNTPLGSCVPCVTGKYNSNKGGTHVDNCKRCPRGRATSTTGTRLCQSCGPGKFTNTQGNTECSLCPPGRFSSNVANSICEACPTGRFITSAGQTACLPCEPGRYAATKASPICSYCAGGTYSEATGATSVSTCIACDAGWFSVIGSTVCSEVPPGHYTDDASSKSIFIPCPAGRYQTKSGATTCTIAPPGRYAPQGAAIALKCPRGTITTVNGSTSMHACEVCQPGTSTSVEGLHVCETCLPDFYNDVAGGVCKTCKDTNNCEDCGPMMTNNLDHTGCIIDDRLSALNQVSLIETLFSTGAALYGAAAISAGFLGLCIVLQIKRQDYKDTLAQLPWMQVVIKSVVPGFTFGSEIFLIMGMSASAPRLASAMIAFRLCHFLSAFLIILTVTTDESINIDFLVHNSFKLASWIEDSFCREHMPFVGGVALLSLCDVTMLQFMPWSQSRFYTESKGWPTLDLLTFCLKTKAAQTLVSVICQITFLIQESNLDDATMSAQAKALFYMNIVVSSGGAIFSLVLLMLKGGFLKQLEKEVDEERGEIRKKKNMFHFLQKLPRKINNFLGRASGDRDNSWRDSSMPSNNEEEGDQNESSLPETNNPLHAQLVQIETDKVKERDKTIAQKNILITTLLSQPGALPPGWIFQFTGQGDLYYIDSNGQSQWEHPSLGVLGSSAGAENVNSDANTNTSKSMKMKSIKDKKDKKDKTKKMLKDSPSAGGGVTGGGEEQI